MYSAMGTIWDHSEEEMLAVVEVTENHDSLQRLLQTERERRGDYKPRQAVINALLEKINKCSTTTNQAAEHREVMRKIYDSYNGDTDPGLAQRFRRVQRQAHEGFCQNIKEMQSNAEKRQRHLEALKKE